MSHSKLPCVIFDTEQLPAAQRFSQWRAGIAPLSEAELQPGLAEDAFSFRSEFHALGLTHFGHTHQHGVGFYRYNGARAVPGVPELYFLQTYLAGGFHGYNGELPMQVAAGDVVLVDALHPFITHVHGEEELLSFVVPRQMLLAALGGRFAPVPRVIPAASPAARLLRQTLLTAWEMLPETDAAGARQIEAMLIGALSGILDADGAQPAETAKADSNTAVFAAMRLHIEQNLHDPALDAAALCKQFHCSRATLYRLFASVEGVAGFIRRRRLERCHADLLSARPGDTVANIARRWGFASEHHFSRLFHGTYAMTPGEALTRGRAVRQ